MSEEEQNLLKRDIASFLRQMHGLKIIQILVNVLLKIINKMY